MRIFGDDLEKKINELENKINDLEKSKVVDMEIICYLKELQIRREMELQRLNNELVNMVSDASLRAQRNMAFYASLTDN